MYFAPVVCPPFDVPAFPEELVLLPELFVEEPFSWLPLIVSLSWINEIVLDVVPLDQLIHCDTEFI